MKHPIRTALGRIEYFWRPFGYWFAPVVAMLAMFATVYGATHVRLSEKLQPYSAFFLILAFLFTAFFLLISAPCAIFSGYLSVKTIVRKKRFILPSIQLLLDIILLVLWFLELKKYVL